MSAIWELSFTVEVTFERDDVGEDYMPNATEERELESAVTEALDAAEIAEVGDWKVDDWKVST
jgi:hypothetical protein